MPIRPSIHTPTHLSIYLSVCLSVRQSVRPSIHPSIYLCVARVWGKVSILSPFLPSCEVLLELFKNKCGISWYVSPDLSRSQPFQALTPDRKKKRRVASKNYEGFVWRELFFLTGLGTLLVFRASAGFYQQSAALTSWRCWGTTNRKLPWEIPRDLSTCSYKLLGEELF